MKHPTYNTVFDTAQAVFKHSTSEVWIVQIINSGIFEF